jgi:hypothetical protein
MGKEDTSKGRVERERGIELKIWKEPFRDASPITSASNQLNQRACDG